MCLELILICVCELFVCLEKILVLIVNKIVRFCDTGSANGATNSQS